MKDRREKTRARSGEGEVGTFSGVQRSKLGLMIISIVPAAITSSEKKIYCEKILGFQRSTK